MPNADELLRSAVIQSDPEGHIVVGGDRFITVPTNLKRLGVQYDHNIETVTFDCPRYWDNHDMSQMTVYINYMLSNQYCDRYPADNVRADDDVMHFEWTISRNVTQVAGAVSFLICVMKTDAEGNEERHWNSELCQDCYISKGMENVENHPALDYPDEITQLLLRMTSVERLNIKGSGAPTSTTEGAVGCLYMDTDTGDLYKCVGAAEGSFTWTSVGGNSNSDAELADIRIAHNGREFTTAGEAVRGQINELRNGYSVFTGEDFVQGYMNSSGLQSISIRIRLKNAVKVKKGDVLSFDNTLRYCIWVLADDNIASPTVLSVTDESIYTATNTSYEIPEDGYLMINMQNAYNWGNSTAITPADFTGEIKLYAVDNPHNELESLLKATTPLYDYIFDNQFEYGTLYKNGTVITYEDTNKVIRTPKGSPLKLKKGDRISTNNGLRIRAVYESGGALVSYGYSLEPFAAPADGEYNVAFNYTDDRVIASIRETLDNDVIIQPGVAYVTQTTVAVNNEAKAAFAIMSYNVGGWYDGSGGRVPDADYQRFLDLQTSIIDRYKPDVLCVQEYADNVSTTKPASFLKERYHFVETARGGTNYDGKAICTNRQIIDSTNIAFTTIDGCNRNYQKVYVYMNGRKVCVISAHLAMTDSVAVENATELLNAVANEDYFIICMDANVDCNDSTTDLYLNTLKRFTDLGYKLCNGGEFGVFNTYADIRYASTPQAIDNIITSAKINIKSVVMDTQKEGLAEGSDHYPLVAYLEIF